MPRGLKQTSSTIAIGFSARETVANTFVQSAVDLNLSPLDNEVFVVLAIDMNPYTPDSLAGIDTKVEATVTTTSQTAVSGLDDSNCLAVAQTHIKAAGFVDSGVGFQTQGMETPPANLEFIGIIATNDFFVQCQGSGNLNTRGVNGKMYGYRARADASIYSALVQSEVLSA
ncbi:MAG: hypothetical protein [Circular genetic element sp.]|nr:MAG: hypothetical protein [Circular genetic element sp.]